MQKYFKDIKKDRDLDKAEAADFQSQTRSFQS